MAAVAQTIGQLNDIECNQIMNLLIPLDKNIVKKVDFVQNQYGLNFREALEYVITNNPILWAKVYLDWEARDYQHAILTEGKRSKKLVLRLGRRLGKCLTGDTLIPDAQTGEYISIQELYQRQQANVLSLNLDKLNIETTNTNIVTDNGIKPVYKVTTVSGREITTTGNHPFYTINGFVELDDLKPRDYVSVAKNIYHTNPITMDENHVKFLAYMIGDGTTTESSNLRFSCHPSVTKVLNEMQQICKANDCKMFKYDSDKDCDWHIKGNQKSHREYNNNHLLTVLQDNDLIGKNAFTKTIPVNIFKLSNEQLKIFLSRLYATDGWATCSNEEKSRVEIGYCSSSKELCKGIQSLLLRFGINSILQEKKVKYNNGYNTSYTLGIYSISDCKKFIENIGIFSKEDAINKVLVVINQMNDYGNKYPIDILKLVEEETIKKKRSRQSLRNYSGVRFNTKYNTISESKLRKANELLESDKLQNVLDADIIWDEIKSIEYIGEQQTYDFTVPNYHNFVANDFITHNTDNMCVLILWFAYTQYNRGPNNQYDIIIATPYETQIDLIFKRLHQLIEISPVLKSLITRDVQHNLNFTINGIVSNILGLTAGANNSSGGANSTRGQRADLLVLDECDYIGSNQITNILNIRNEAPERIRLICASTPSGKHEEYYRWCVGASKKYFPTQDDIKNNKFSGYEIEEKEIGKGNGWTEIYAPSNVNKELLKINPDTQQTYLEDIKDELSDMRYTQEVMAEFGEEEMGVYQKRFIMAAIMEGERLHYRYITKWAKEDRKSYLSRTQGQNIRILGVKFIPNVLTMCA
jgi:intein/homing endonuclease